DGGEQRTLFVVVVVALRPVDDGPWRILPVPGPRIFLRIENSFLRVGAAVPEGLIESADAVVHGCEEHQVAGAPCIEVPMREYTGHAETLHLRDIVPAKLSPLIGEQRVYPRVIRTVADRVVVEERHRFVQIVENLRVPIEIRVQYVAREIKRHSHHITVVVMRDIMPPVEEVRVLLFRVGLVPAINVDLAIASIDLDNRCDENDHMRADELDV